MKIKTNELVGAALDWAVAKCLTLEGRNQGFTVIDGQPYVIGRDGGNGGLSGAFFSRDPAQAWPIIDREGIATRKASTGTWYAMLSDDLGDGDRAQWCLFTFRNVPRSASTSRQCRFQGDTALIAAMRCHVASKLGDEVEVPDELLS